ncbi:hypothetical protein OAH18_02765, partial [bacterium]|nr:hypothetical protein [bacterium]
LVENHAKYTGSKTATDILSDWDTNLKKFTKVMPVDYKRALTEMAKEKAQAKNTKVSFGTQL